MQFTVTELVGALAMQLTVHEAVLKYLCGIDPVTQWKAWGGRGSHVDGDDQAIKAQEQEGAILRQALADPEMQKKANEFGQESYDLMNGFTAGDRSVTGKYLDGKKFYFVSGIMRSGGTYIFQEVGSCLGIEWNKLSFPMSHDAIPTYKLLKEYHKPEAFMPLLFEICQFLVWVRRETGDAPYVVQKRIAYAHAIPFLESIFGERAEYLITIRHPGSSCTSFAEMEGIDEESVPPQSPNGWKSTVLTRNPFIRDWDRLDFRHRYLMFWRTYYMDVVRSGMALERIHPNLYGDGMAAFVTDLSNSLGKDYEPSPFVPRIRDCHPF